MKFSSLVLSFVLISSFAVGAFAQDESEAKSEKEKSSFPLRFDSSATFNFVVQEVDGSGGQTVRITESSLFGINLTGVYSKWKWVHPGLFLQFDVGNRFLTNFAGFANAGGASINEVSGTFYEIWLGPLVRIPWRSFFFEGGYGALALRWDDLRNDIPSNTGGIGAFQTDPAFSWYAGVGGNVKLTSRLHLLLKLVYRLRYYDTRGGDDLTGDVRLGTQDVNPFIGVSYWLD